MTPPGAPPLAGRVAIVTGASRGIGQATAAALAELGAEVIVTSRQREAAEQAAREIGPQATGIAAHASDETAARACVDFALERFGRLDILVNNAGTNPAAGRLVDVDRSRFNKTVEVNLWAPMLWTGLAWHAWMSEHGGCVINTASVGGLVVGPNLGVYNTTKAALIHLTRQMAIELAPRVRVNAVAPGVVRTKLAAALWSEREAEVTAVTPLGRIGEPADVAAAMSFLASDAASWITGQTFVIDGGQMLVAPIGGDEPGRLP